jgi:glycosyltransferase involved in cell wall biosynthesis
VIFDTTKRPILLWGTGSLAQTVFERLRGEVRFAGVINNLGGSDSPWNGLPVLTASEALDTPGVRPFVVIATMFLEAIVPELERRGLHPYVDWCPPEHALRRLRPHAGSGTRSKPDTGALRVLHVNWNIWGSGFSGGHVSHAEALIASLGALPNLEQAYLYTAVREKAGDTPLITSSQERLRVYEIAHNPIWTPFEPPDHDLDDEVVETLVSRVLEDYRPDVVHVHHLIQFPLAVIDVIRRRHRVPVVVTVRDYWYVCKQATLLNHLGRLCDSNNDCRLCGDCLRHNSSASLDPATPRLSQEQFLCRKYRYLHALEQCEALTFVSRFLRDEYLTLGLSGDNAHICRNGMPFVPRPVRRTPAAPVNVAFVGHIREYKGAYFVLESLKSWRGTPFHLHFWGLVDDETRFESAVRELPEHVRVTFHGAYRRQDLPTLLAEVNLGLAPSLVPDTAPQVVMEFFACGIPVLGARIGGIPESVLDDVNGVLFEPGEPDSFLAALERALTPEALSRLAGGIDAPRSIETYAAEIHALYRRVATAGHHADEGSPLD